MIVTNYGHQCDERSKQREKMIDRRYHRSLQLFTWGACAAMTTKLVFFTDYSTRRGRTQPHVFTDVRCRTIQRITTAWHSWWSRDMLVHDAIAVAASTHIHTDIVSAALLRALPLCVCSSSSLPTASSTSSLASTRSSRRLRQNQRLRSRLRAPTRLHLLRHRLRSSSNE